MKALFVVRNSNEVSYFYAIPTDSIAHPRRTIVWTESMEKRWPVYSDVVVLPASFWLRIVNRFESDYSPRGAKASKMIADVFSVGSTIKATYIARTYKYIRFENTRRPGWIGNVNPSVGDILSLRSF